VCVCAPLAVREMCLGVRHLLACLYPLCYKHLSADFLQQWWFTLLALHCEWVSRFASLHATSLLARVALGGVTVCACASRWPVAPGGMLVLCMSLQHSFASFLLLHVWQHCEWCVGLVPCQFA
jgi:hypothetical protein